MWRDPGGYVRAVPNTGSGPPSLGGCPELEGFKCCPLSPVCLVSPVVSVACPEWLFRVSPIFRGELPSSCSSSGTYDDSFVLYNIGRVCVHQDGRFLRKDPHFLYPLDLMIIEESPVRVLCRFYKGNVVSFFRVPLMDNHHLELVFSSLTSSVRQVLTLPIQF